MHAVENFWNAFVFRFSWWWWFLRFFCFLRIVKVYSNASSFRMTECVSGGYWNKWGEGVCHLHRKVEGNFCQSELLTGLILREF
jgi:hypothetical protein